MQPLTAERLEKKALRYLERYGGSRARLEATLARAIERAGGPEGAAVWAHEIVARFERLGYIDDARYAEDLARTMRRRGASTAKIRAAMVARGVPSAIAEQVAAGDDEEAARAFVRRRRLGRDPERYKRDLAALGRAGFDLETARRALGQE